MRSDYELVDADPAVRRSWLPLVLIPLFAFVAGLAAMGWLLANWQSAAAFLGVARAPLPAQAEAPLPAVSVESEPPAAMPPNPQEPQRLLLDPEMMRRVNRLEERIVQVQNQSLAAAGNADRAEGLLVAFAARRALDRGVSLGYIEGLLRERFGQSQRQAVATIITGARQPVTLEDLQLGLQEAGPQLTGGGPDQSWWSAFRTELAGLVTIRKANTPSTLPAERLRRATRRLESGQVDVALAEVLRMPNRDKAADWIAAARRYVAARRALDTIETAALLDPRNPPQIAPRPPAPAPTG
ncbi:hypothetical protein [Sphingosinicella rhizophila]|uniref:Inner membrane protein n=1 Tax=Sphingosinicella rhizophila TaxID=3050082 RepID=A0ABU3Q9G9_9SPHN|nr:hypothetical protein [Sphingosinicella sp. GR2756]MDT9599590.1 hypothetical protein [Sphingosinicella sp. GR2756]